MLKATRNGLDLCIYFFPPCITLPSGKQLWQTLMKNINWKLNYLNADSYSTHRCRHHQPSICKISLCQGSAEHWAECSIFEASIKVVARKIETAQLKVIWHGRWNLLLIHVWHCIDFCFFIGITFVKWNVIEVVMNSKKINTCH